MGTPVDRREKRTRPSNSSMEELLDILREEKVKELIEETARFYYTSPATTVNLLLPIALSGLFLLVVVGVTQIVTPEVLRNLASLPRLLLLPIRKLAGPLKGLAASLKSTVASLETTWEDAAYGAPAYGAPEPSYGAPAPSYSAPGYARSFQEEGEELSKLVSSKLESGAESAVQPQISLDTMADPIVQKLLQ